MRVLRSRQLSALKQILLEGNSFLLGKTENCTILSVYRQQSF